MGKNDFDIDFDFEKEYGFDPKDFLGSEENDNEIDLSEFSDEELGLKAPAKDEDLDLGGLDLNGDYDMGDDDLDLDDFLNLGNQEQPADVQEDPEEEYLPEEEMEEELFADEAEPEEPELLTREAAPEETVMRDTEYTEEETLEPEDFEAPEYDEEEYDEEPAKVRRERKPIKLPKITLPKLPKPNIFTKFFDLYFGPVLDKSKREELVDPNNPRRRRRKSKAQIFKEVYLPPILACVCLILVLSFTIGSVSNAIAQNKIEKEAEESRLSESQSAAALQEQMIQSAIIEADRLAAGYDYDAAIDTLKTAGDISSNKELAAKHSEYVNAQTALLEYKDISAIPNLSFHVLVHDMARALKDEEFGGSYNKNFVTTAEFTQILNSLYNNGYVLVDFDSFVEVNQDLSGNDQYYAGSLWLPADKKPVMITETMVNYFNYMVDGDGDKVPDANGDGFANKLVVDNNGNIKAEYIDSNGQTLTGNYDLVPILEDFIKEHPDFSYRGARAILAVTGHEGIFGYRVNTSYIQSISNEYYEAQKAGAIEIVNALKEKGYTIACYTYSNMPYGGKSASQISADLESWTKQIVEVIGPVDTFVFAKNSAITDYSGSVFDVMQSCGFRYYISQGTQPWAEVNTSYVRQNRLMVTGENMFWYPDQFKNLFDCAAIVDVTTRGDIPKSA